jgi:predicted membrane-bound spermidine synthase
VSNTPGASTKALPNGVATAAVFLASAAVLVLEVVGLRLVGPYLGVTLQTSSAVIGIALAAIAYGAWTGGFLADRMNPRHLLAPALVLAGVVTAVTLPLVRWAGELLRGSASVGTLLLTALAVFVPAALLSAITPLVVKLQLSDVDHTGRVVGRLSSIGTLGGITATLGTGFVLVAALPTSVILLSLAVVLAAAGMALHIYLRHTGDTPLPRRRAAMLAAIGLGGTGLSVVAPNPCDVETAYHCATVVVDEARPTGRLLLLNSARHSYVDLADPRHLEFAYAQWFGAFVDTFRPAGQPVRVLHLGGGGFTMPRYVEATRPGSFGRVLELDGELVALDRAQLGVVPGPRLDIIIGDGRTALAQQSTGDFDLVIGDAFGHLTVPWHLTTKEFTAEVRRVLRPNGAYILNVIDYPPSVFVRAELATIQAVFPHVAVISGPTALAGEVGANFAILASIAPLPVDEMRERLSSQPEPATLLTGAELTSFVDDARILTDDLAPVDQLLNRG